MRGVRILVFLGTVMALPLTCQAANPTGDTRTRIDQYMQAVAKQQHFMGAVLVARGDDVILAKGYGKANLDQDIAITPDTEFRIGSVTKQFTAMAILMLQAQGKLDVSDPVCDYVPDCPADWQSITIANLLTHTSGIPNFTAFPGYSNVRSQTMTPAELVALFKDRPLEFKPGAKFSYSNSGYVLLGYIIERVSGQSYATFLEQHIFEPLGMTASGYDKNHPTAKHHAKGYDYTDGTYERAPFVDMSVPFSAGALYSTVRDMYRWDRALDANDGKLIPKSLHAAMFAPHVRVDGEPGTDESAKDAVHYGYGWFVNRQFGHLQYSHEGGIAGFTALNSWYPDEHVYIIVLDNMNSPDVSRIGKNLAAIVFGEPYTMPKPFKAISLPAAALEKFVGTYQMAPKRFMSITRDGDQLRAQLTGQPAFEIYPETPTHFFLKVVRAQIYFQTDEQGNVTGLELHQNGMTLPGKRLSASQAREAIKTPQAISLPPQALEKFVGAYQLAPDFTLTITREGDQLSAQATGQPAVPIYPTSETEFFLKAVDARITFVRDGEGKVTKLILHQHGRDMPAQKVK